MTAITQQSTRRTMLAGSLGAVLCVLAGDGASAQLDPLPSWQDGTAKKSITDFVARVTTPGGADFVQPASRIAVFDNDGTLWSEQPGLARAPGLGRGRHV
jgi:hypothetical protein